MTEMEQILLILYLRKQYTETQLRPVFLHVTQRGGNVQKLLYSLPLAEKNIQEAQQWKETFVNFMEQCHEKGIHLLPLFHPHYPSLLKHIYDPPLLLFISGNISLLQLPFLAIVGSRRPMATSISFVHSVLAQIQKFPFTIGVASGLAAGVDAAVHTYALRYEVPTVSVLGFGHAHIYPKENIGLKKEIEQYGCSISEYPPHTKPKPYQFAKRNRIISGLSYGTFIVEAKKKSGSMITADLALQEGRDVFVWDHDIYRKEEDAFEGSRNLIEEGAISIKSEREIEKYVKKYYNFHDFY